MSNDPYQAQLNLMDDAELEAATASLACMVGDRHLTEHE